MRQFLVDRFVVVLCYRGEECFPAGSFCSWEDESSPSSCSSNSSSKGGEPYRRSFPQYLLSMGDPRRSLFRVSFQGEIFLEFVRCDRSP